MKNNAFLKHHTPVIAGSCFFVVCCLFYALCGFYNFCYIEQWKTFLYDSSYISSILSLPGGTVELIANFLIQFFRYPIAGILITSCLLSVIFALGIAVSKRWLGNYHWLPSALLPVTALMLLHFNINYQYSGTVAFALMLASILLQLRMKHTVWRYLYSLGSCILLFFLAGPIALLQACLLCIIELSKDVQKGWLYLTLPVVVFLLAQCSLWTGDYGELKHILLPDGYFTHRLQAGSSIYLPWGVTAGIFLLQGCYRRCKPTPLFTSILLGIQCLAVGTFIYFNAPSHISRDNEIFKEMNYWARQEKWEHLISRSKELPMRNLLHQNYVNMALAEKGILVKELKNYPNIGIQSLFINGNKTPYISAMLSDIYFTMGHLSFSRRYAFEANESAGNYSPKLLQRLVLTSLIYGEYELADKYIRLLESTLFYKDWANRQRRFLNPKALEEDTFLMNKRKCLFPDNRFAGSKGLDNDLKEILKHNPEHQATGQYLEAIRLFIGNQ